MNEHSIAKRLVEATSTGFGGQLGSRVGSQFVPAVFDLNDFYIFNETTGTWKIIDFDSARALVMQLLDQVNAINAASPIEASAGQITGVITNARSILWRQNPNFFKNAPRGLAFQNGYLKLNDQNLVELHAHAPEFGARFQASYACAEQHTPKWDATLERVFAGDPDKDDKIALLHEFIGAALLGVAPRLSRCMICLGEGSNGKSTIQAIIRALFPPELVCTSNPQTWHKEYDRAELSGKRINITGELPEREMLESEAFKTIVEGGTISARVIRQSPFQFNPEAAHLFSANSMLKTNDYSHGFFRRFIMLPFNNSFEQTPEDYVAPIVNEELGGIAFKAVRALEKALAAKNYTLPQSAIETLAEWKVQANPVANFVEHCLVKVDDSQMTSSEIWNVWVKWTELYKFHPLNLTTFGRRLIQILGKSSRMRTVHGTTYNVALSPAGAAIASRNILV